MSCIKAMAMQEPLVDVVDPEQVWECGKACRPGLVERDGAGNGVWRGSAYQSWGPVERHGDAQTWRDPLE
eukprot:218922-Chlamydomonas_euryale.AAC.1